MATLPTLHSSAKTAVPSGAGILISVDNGSGGRTFDELVPSALAALGFKLRGAWAASTAYALGDVVTYQGSSYAALAAFTSGSAFAASNWQLLASKGDTGPAGTGSGVAYTLPAATSSALGGVKQGTGVTIAGDGTISAASTGNAPIATTSAAGTIKPDGTTLTVASDGTASVAGVGVPALTDAATLTGANYATGLLTINIGNTDYKFALGAAISSQTTTIGALQHSTSVDLNKQIAIFDPTTNATTYCSLGQLASLFASGNQSSSGSMAAAATTFTNSLSNSSGTVGSTTTMTVTPGTGGWPSGEVVTPTATTVTGTFSPTSATPSGTTPATFVFTSSGSPAVGTLNATAPNMTSGGGQTYTSTATSGSTNYPSMTFTSPGSYADGKFAKGLTSGTGSAPTAVIPVNSTLISGYAADQGQVILSWWYIRGTGAVSNGTAFMKFASGTNASGQAGSITDFALFNAGVLGSAVEGASANSGGPSLYDNLPHYIEARIGSNYNATYVDIQVDCAAAYSHSGSGYLASGVAAQLMLYANNLGGGDVIDDVQVRGGGAFLSTNPTSAVIRGAGTLLLLPLNGSGAGS